MIGIDIVSIPRIEKMINKFGNRALKKFLNESEINLIKSPQTAAGFWAAKEAISKALGCGIGSELSFHDINISKTSKGKPIAFLTKEKYKYFNIEKIDISITHEKEFAIAAAIVLKNQF
ncbi:holo-ACP synthase [Nautilia lithotrophica]